MRAKRMRVCVVLPILRKHHNTYRRAHRNRQFIYYVVTATVIGQALGNPGHPVKAIHPVQHDRELIIADLFKHVIGAQAIVQGAALFVASGSYPTCWPKVSSSSRCSHRRSTIRVLTYPVARTRRSARVSSFTHIVGFHLLQHGVATTRAWIATTCTCLVGKPPVRGHGEWQHLYQTGSAHRSSLECWVLICMEPPLGTCIMRCCLLGPGLEMGVPARQDELSIN